MSLATLDAPVMMSVPAAIGRPAIRRDRTATRNRVTINDHRAARCRKVIRVRRSLAADTYVNDLKLSIALDRLMDVLERG